MDVAQHRRLEHAGDLGSRTIAELLEILNEQRNLISEESEGTTHLCAPASCEEMESLTSRLFGHHGPEQLDPDYRAFLKFSNGFYRYRKGQEDCITIRMEGIFHHVKGISKDTDVDFHLFQTNPILHPLPGDLSGRFDWGNGIGIDIGPAGDEGNLWMFCKSELQRAFDHLDETYPNLTDSQKTQVDNLILKIYGSQEAMRKQHFTLMEFYHWSPEIKLHLGFRAYLESLIRTALPNEYLSNMPAPDRALEKV